MGANHKLIAEIALKDCDVLVEKEKSYGDSWKSRGGVGAFMMLARKWDRIEHQCKEKGYNMFEAVDMLDEQGLLDDIGDLRRYLLLVEQHVRDTSRVITFNNAGYPCATPEGDATKAYTGQT